MKSLADYKVSIIGGCGHVGLPLGVKFALAGAKTTLVDIDARAVRTVLSGKFPFLEEGGDEQLAAALAAGLQVRSDPEACRGSDAIVFVIGTPVDEHLNPKLSDITRTFESYEPFFSPGTLIIMRSTLFPGTMTYLHKRVQQLSVPLRLAFCPERVSQGMALEEIDNLPQIVSAFDDESFAAAYDLFSALAPEIIRLTPLEAEMTKLMANSWRYLEFAIANQFYMIAESHGIDFYKIYQAIRHRYPRAAGYKSPGFAAGPCLFKDTMQLASFFDHQFNMGHSAMLVNEGLADFVVNRAAQSFGGTLWGKTVGLLGLAFKSNNDDIRESLSFRVKKGLEFKGARVLAHDPFVAGADPLDEVLDKSDLLILCTPHPHYRSLELRRPIIDVWGALGQPRLEILPGTDESNALESDSARKVANK